MSLHYIMNKLQTKKGPRKKREQYSYWKSKSNESDNKNIDNRQPKSIRCNCFNQDRCLKVLQRKRISRIHIYVCRVCVCVCVCVCVYVCVYTYIHTYILGFPGDPVIQNMLAMQEMWVQSLGQKNPWSRKWQPTPVFLPGKLHGQRSPVGSSPWGCKRVSYDLVMKQQLYIYTQTHTHTHTHIMMTVWFMHLWRLRSPTIFHL